ncbi:MAG: hypothetical protein HUK22_03515 [Thermoguttaceae bacterium]|nr:hypothetical protein [Thermoguttaceae bacterium]
MTFQGWKNRLFERWERIREPLISGLVRVAVYALVATGRAYLWAKRLKKYWKENKSELKAARKAFLARIWRAIEDAVALVGMYAVYGVVAVAIGARWLVAQCKDALKRLKSAQTA